MTVMNVKHVGPSTSSSDTYYINETIATMVQSRLSAGKDSVISFPTHRGERVLKVYIIVANIISVTFEAAE